MMSIRWDNGEPVCPRCGSYETSFISTRKIWKCKGCKRQFSLKVGTIFEDSGLGFDKASGTFQKLSGTIETDETYIGGLAKNMHKSTKARRVHGTGGKDKVAIHGALERGGSIVAAKVDRVSSKELQGSIRNWVETGSTVYTDQSNAYTGMDIWFDHKFVTHATGEYVRGDVSTNGIENFWNLYKRAWKGTYTHNLPKHTDRYIAERTF
jgi:transposase-like protein